MLQLGWEVPQVGQTPLSLEGICFFSAEPGFIGSYDFRFDNYLMSQNDLYGKRDGETCVNWTKGSG